MCPASFSDVGMPVPSGIRSPFQGKQTKSASSWRIKKGFTHASAPMLRREEEGRVRDPSDECDEGLLQWTLFFYS